VDDDGDGPTPASAFDDGDGDGRGDGDTSIFGAVTVVTDVCRTAPASWPVGEEVDAAGAGERTPDGGNFMPALVLLLIGTVVDDVPLPSVLPLRCCCCCRRDDEYAPTCLSLPARAV